VFQMTRCGTPAMPGHIHSLATADQGRPLKYGSAPGLHDEDGMRHARQALTLSIHCLGDQP
jgi:hypothetical protein